MNTAVADRLPDDPYYVPVSDEKPRDHAEMPCCVATPTFSMNKGPMLQGRTHEFRWLGVVEDGCHLSRWTFPPLFSLVRVTMSNVTRFGEAM